MHPFVQPPEPIVFPDPIQQARNPNWQVQAWYRNAIQNLQWEEYVPDQDDE